MKKVIVSLVALAAIALSGCALLQADSAAGLGLEQGLGLVVQVYVTNHGGGTAAGNAAVAQNIVNGATVIEGVATGSVTVTQFNAQMQQYIAKVTNATQQKILTDILAQADLYFSQHQVNKVGSGVLGATFQAGAAVVLNDIIAAAQAFIPGATVVAVKHS